MARALSGSSLLFAGAALVAKRRRGYSTAAYAAATGSGRFPASSADAEWAALRTSASASASESSSSLSSVACSSWLPDPATGFYRPASRSGEVDVAELRRILLKNRS